MNLDALTNELEAVDGEFDLGKETLEQLLDKLGTSRHIPPVGPLMLFRQV